MKELKLNAELSEKIIDGGIRVLLAAILSGAQVFGGYAPFAIGFAAAAGNGWRGMCALLGTAAGALLFLDFAHMLRTLAVCILLYTANNSLGDARVYRRRWFLPTLTAALMLSVEFVYVLRGEKAESAYCLAALMLAVLAADSCRAALAPDRDAHPRALLVVLLGVLMAAASLETRDGFAPGRILAMLAVMLLSFQRGRTSAVSAALCIGLAMDLAAQGDGFVHAALYAAASLSMSLARRGDRVRGALWFLGGILILALPLYARDGILLLYEALAAALCFLLIPSKLLRGGKRAAPPPDRDVIWSNRLKDSAEALHELYDSVYRGAKSSEENPAVIFDRAAEQVCRDCALRTQCWEKEYNRTYTALNDATAALLRSGQGRGEDFAAYFVDRCISFPRFLEAVNGEVHDYLLRRSHRKEIDDLRRSAAGQYAQFSELLRSAADREESRAAMAQQKLPYQLGAMLRPKHGERISGDSAATFEVGEKLYLILSDGMGSGEEARRESAMAVRLLERFLRAGIDVRPALKTLNAALALRSESGSFTTVDLLELSLLTGEAEHFKYGAAPSYVKRNGTVKRVSCTCLPAGLQTGAQPPEATRVHLESGCCFVMITDGVADAQEDEWLQNLLAGWEGENPQLLVGAILADSMEKKGKEDDAGVVVLHLPKGEGNAPQQV